MSKACKSGLMEAMEARRRFVGGPQICRTSKNVPTRSSIRSKSNMRAAASLVTKRASEPSGSYRTLADDYVSAAASRFSEK